MVEGFKNTEVGLIPKDWEVKNIVENSTMKARIGWQGLTVAEYLEKGDYYLITGTDFINGKIKWETCYYVNKDRYVQDKNIQIKVGDILITKDGTIGKVAYIDRLPLDATLNSGVFVIRPKSNSYLPLFLFNIFNSIYFREFLNKLVAGSTINHLYQKDFVSFNFPLPPTKAEQTAIATALNDADALISHLEKLIAKKRAIKQGAMQELLKPKEGWEEKELGEVAGIRRGASPRPIQDPKWFSDSGRGWIRISDVTNSKVYLNSTTQYLSEAGVRNSVTVDKGDLIMSICATIGIPIIINIPACIHDGFVLFKNYKKVLDTFFLYFFLQKQTDILISKGQPGTQMNLNISIVGNIEISFPKLVEQNRIGLIIRDIEIELSGLQKKLEKYKLIKQGMMQQLLTGKIRLVKIIANEQSKEEVVKQEIKTETKHNWEINEAVVIAVLSDRFGNHKFPLYRKRCTKLTYLLHRYKERKAEGYLKKAAGPYNPAIKYKGPEMIALKNKYVQEYSNEKIKGFIAGDNIEQAKTYFHNWYGNDLLEWLDQFRYIKMDDLELWATVDMAIEDLKVNKTEVSLETVKSIIQNNSDWKAKLDRPVFSDDNILKAIHKCEELFGDKNEV